MKGIKLSHGVAFVEHEGVTVRVNSDGTCVLSSRQLPSVEWDLRTEPPSSWDYLDENDIKNLPDNGYEKIEAAFRARLT